MGHIDRIDENLGKRTVKTAADGRRYSDLDGKGKLVLYPASAGATYKMAYNPSSTIAALRSVLEPVKLQYIDFIKVQCGVLSKSGWLGEISTEVFSFEDLSITNNQ